jgi:hypothetical protein
MDWDILNENELTALASSCGDDCDMAAVKCVVREVRALRVDRDRLVKERDEWKATSARVATERRADEMSAIHQRDAALASAAEMRGVYEAAKEWRRVWRPNHRAADRVAANEQLEAAIDAALAGKGERT